MDYYCHKTDLTRKGRTFFVLSFFFLSNFYSIGQELPLISGEKGVVILKNDKVLLGRVSYNANFEIVICEKNGQKLAFNASQVNMFQIYDKEHKLNRIFTSLQYLPENTYYAYKRNIFMELIMADDFTILRKQKLSVQELATTAQGKDFFIAQSFPTRTVQVYDYDYFFQKGNEIILISDFKKQILPFMKDYEREVNQFINEHHLNIDTFEGQYRVFEFYVKIKKRKLISLEDALI